MSIVVEDDRILLAMIYHSKYQADVGFDLLLHPVMRAMVQSILPVIYGRHWHWHKSRVYKEHGFDTILFDDNKLFLTLSARSSYIWTRMAVYVCALLFIYKPGICIKWLDIDARLHRLIVEKTKEVWSRRLIPYTGDTGYHPRHMGLGLQKLVIYNVSNMIGSVPRTRAVILSQSSNEMEEDIEEALVSCDLLIRLNPTPIIGLLKRLIASTRFKNAVIASNNYLDDSPLMVLPHYQPSPVLHSHPHLIHLSIIDSLLVMALVFRVKRLMPTWVYENCKKKGSIYPCGLCNDLREYLFSFLDYTPLCLAMKQLCRQ